MRVSLANQLNGLSSDYSVSNRTNGKITASRQIRDRCVHGGLRNAQERFQIQRLWVAYLGRWVPRLPSRGLDRYCGFYAILNLINFLKYKEDRSNVDFIGADKFREFRRFIDTFVFDGPFPKRPFGDDGLTQKLLFYALSRALEHFEIVARLVVGQNLPETAASALGLAAVREGEDDNLAHWVAFIGKDHLNDLNGTGIACESDWKGIVLDSDRGYERWWVGRDGQAKIKRGGEAKGTLVELPWRFVFVHL